jgi:cytochrome c-type biogenesis protein CcmF
VIVGVRARRRATREPVPVATYGAVRSNPRLYGGLVVHVGVVIVALALATTSGYTTKREVRLAPGQSATVRGFTVTYLRTTVDEGAQKTTIAAEVRARRGTKELGTFRPAISTYPNFSGGIGTPAIRTGPWHDLYLTLVSAPTSGRAGGAITLGVQVGTFVLWLWIGGVVMVLGILLALAPARRRRPVVTRAREADGTRELAEAAT